MGSKRVDQIHKDLLSTDRKSRPEDEHIHEEDKQAVRASEQQSHIPERGENPVLADLKRKREEPAEE
jgi:hypothetical protein